MPKDLNEEAFKNALKDANLPEFPDMDSINDALKAQARVSIHHSWHQEGPSLVCDSCPHRHSQWIGQNKRLIGFDNEGRPKIENLM